MVWQIQMKWKKKTTDEIKFPKLMCVLLLLLLLKFWYCRYVIRRLIVRLSLNKCKPHYILIDSIWYRNRTSQHIGTWIELKTSDLLNVWMCGWHKQTHARIHVRRERRDNWNESKRERKSECDWERVNEMEQENKS